MVAIRRLSAFWGKTTEWIFRNSDPSGIAITFSPSGVEQFWCYGNVSIGPDTSASLNKNSLDEFIHVGQELRTSQLVYTSLSSEETS